MNFADVRPAIANIKPLLFKWAVICVILAIPVAILSMNTLAYAVIVEKTDVLGVYSRDRPDKKKVKKIPHRTLQKKSPRSPRVVPPPNPRGYAVQPVNTSGNIYPEGQCTWYAKQMRPDLPNRMGNADRWISSAQKYGIPTGSTPKEKAIGQKGKHVVYVEKVNPDGTMLINDMNYVGRGKHDRRIVASTGYKFIY